MPARASGPVGNPTETTGTDGGTGMLRALGVHLLDHNNNELPPGGSALTDLARIVLDKTKAPLHTMPFTLATDVTNSPLGDNGAAAVFWRRRIRRGRRNVEPPPP